MDINGARLAYSTKTQPTLAHHPQAALDKILGARKQEPFLVTDQIAVDMDPDEVLNPTPKGRHMADDVTAKNIRRPRTAKMPWPLKPTPEQQFRAEHYREDTPKGPICHECGTDYPCRPIVLMDEIAAIRS